MWSHFQDLYRKSQAESGLFIGKRLTREHILLTSYSRMRVDLAAQVYIHIHAYVVPQYMSIPQ